MRLCILLSSILGQINQNITTTNRQCYESSHLDQILGFFNVYLVLIYDTKPYSSNVLVLSSCSFFTVKRFLSGRVKLICSGLSSKADAVISIRVVGCLT